MNGKFALVLVPCVLASLASANTSSFDKRHNWNLRLNSNQIYRVAWGWNVRTVAVGQTTRDSDQDFGSAGYGLAPAFDSKTVTSNADGATATATSQFDASANGTGFHRLFGTASVTKGVGKMAYSQSVSQVGLNIGTVDGRGRISWRPNWIIDVLRGPGAERDPLDFQVFNMDTAQLYQERLFEVGIDLDDGGMASWLNGTITVQAPSGKFWVSVGAPHVTTAGGSAYLEFSNGVITQSNSSGVFNGVFPGVGASSSFSTLFGDANGDVNMDFDYGAANVNGYDFTVGMGAAASVQATPEPATLAILGLGAAAVLRRRKSA